MNVMYSTFYYIWVIYSYTWRLLNDRLHFVACFIVQSNRELNSNLGPPSRVACSVLYSPRFPPCSRFPHRFDEYLSIMFTRISLISSLSPIHQIAKEPTLTLPARGISPRHDFLTKKKMYCVASIQINEWLLLWVFD
jgi:hypothetical protein